MNQSYMHRNSLDTFITIKRLAVETSDAYIFVVDYRNLGCTGNPWLLLENQVVTVDKFNWKKHWVDISDKLNTKRTRSGLP